LALPAPVADSELITLAARVGDPDRWLNAATQAGL
jgi:hypothetical protein